MKFTVKDDKPLQYLSSFSEFEIENVMVNTDEDIKDIYGKVFGNVYQNRFDKLVRIYNDLGYDNVEFVRYPNYGHSGTPGIQHTTELILKYRNL